MTSRRRLGAAIALVVCWAAAASAQDVPRPVATPLTSNRFTYKFALDYMLQASARRDFPFRDATFQDNESFTWWRFRPRMTGHSRHVDFMIEGQDTHSAGTTPTFAARKAWMDLLNAYATVRAPRGWEFKAGRQQGDLEVIPRMVRTSDFAAIVRSFDVAEVGWRNKQNDVRAFVFKTVDNLPTQFNREKDGERLWTTYAKRTLSPTASVQSYVTARHNRQVVGETGVPGTSAIYAWETQVEGPTPAAAITWTAESVLQRGHYARDAVKAWGLFLRTDVDLPGNSAFDVRYNQSSGDGDHADGVRSQYDTYYSAANLFGALGLFRGTNIRNLSLGGNVVLARPLNLYYRYHNTHLNTRGDGWYSAAVPNFSVGNPDSTLFGQETDLTLFIQVTPKLQVRTAYHQFYPGSYSPAAIGKPYELRLQVIGSL